MNSGKIKLFIDMLDKYMQTHAYDYVIRCISPYENGILFSIGELTPSNQELSPYILIIEYKDGRLSFKNGEFKDLVYDYLEEDGRSLQEADNYMAQFYLMMEEVEEEIFWYELCFFGDEDDKSEKYNEEKACSYVIKTEIPPVIDDKVALQILTQNMDKDIAEELKKNLTCISQITEEEASSYFFVEDYTIRVTDSLGTYWKRKK